MARAFRNSRYAFAFEVGTLPCHILEIIDPPFKYKLGSYVKSVQTAKLEAFKEQNLNANYSKSANEREFFLFAKIRLLRAFCVKTALQIIHHLPNGKILK